MGQSIYELARTLRKNQTKAEAFFWSRVRKRRILNCLFLRQYVIEYPNRLNKKSYFIVDFFCREKKLIVEIDGEIHNHQIDYDQQRQSILEDQNFTVIRFTNSDVINNWNDVENRLKKKILEIGMNE